LKRKWSDDGRRVVVELSDNQKAKILAIKQTAAADLKLKDVVKLLGFIIDMLAEDEDMGAE
jgi:hypothetical protein